MATVTQLTVLIKGQQTVTPATTAANKGLGTLGTTASKTTGLLGQLGGTGALIKTGLVAAAALGAKSLVNMGMESERVNAQTVAGLKSTGGAANVTLGEIQALAQGIMNYSGISDEAVQTSSNMLLTFTNVRNEVGAGNDVFNQASVAVADMATKMSGGATPSAEAMQGAALKLGKALNDPIAGMGALSRVGVQFTAQQKEQITALAQSGNALGAQKIILAELTKEFGGSAKALGATFEGTFNRIKETVGNVLEGLVVGLFKVLAPLLTVVGVALQLAMAAGVLTPAIIAMAVAWGAYTIASNTALASTIATTVAAWLGVPALTALGVAATIAKVGLGPLIGIAAAVAIGLVLMFKLVQAGMSALSGGWSKMSGLMKATLIVLAPVWVPIVIAIKTVIGLFNMVKGAVLAVWNVTKAFVSNWLAGLQPIGEFLAGTVALLKEVGTWAGNAAHAVANFATGGLVNIAGQIEAANKAAQSADLRTWALELETAMKTGGVALQDYIMKVQELKATNPAQFAAMFKQTITQVDAALASGAISAQQAQRAYIAWGMSTANASKRAQGAAQASQQAAQIVASSSQIMTGAMSRLGNAGKLTEQKLVSAFRKSAQAAMQLAKNSNIVAQRFSQSTGMSETRATALVKTLQDEFGDKAPQIMSLLAKSSGKNFASMAKNILTGREGFEQFTPSVEKSGKVAGDAAKGQQDLAKASGETGKAGTTAAKGQTALGNSVQSGQSKVSGMTTQVARLSSELNGLPSQVRIEVTVNVSKTGQSLGGIVPGLARGGTSTMPFTEVGEWGREMAALPPGTRVYSHAETMGLSAAMAGRGGGASGPLTIRGKLKMVGSEAYIEGVVEDMLDDGSLMDDVLTRAMRRP